LFRVEFLLLCSSAYLRCSACVYSRIYMQMLCTPGSETYVDFIVSKSSFSCSCITAVVLLWKPRGGNCLQIYSAKLNSGISGICVIWELAGSTRMICAYLCAVWNMYSPLEQLHPHAEWGTCAKDIANKLN